MLKLWSILCVCAYLASYVPCQGATKADSQWETSLTAAATRSKKENKVLVAYFRGSDWCPWCQKLEKEVLKTEAFLDWAKANVVLLDVDLPTSKARQSPTLKAQNDGLKDRYNVTRTPTFVFLDPAGDEIDRCGYDTAKLLPAEQTGQPTAWLKYLQKVIAQRPDAPDLIVQPDLNHGIDFAKKKARPLLMFLTRGDAPAAKVEEIEQKIMKDPRFVRLANRQFSYVRQAWPADDDRTKDATAFRSFAKTFNLLPAPVQLVVWDAGRREIVSRLTQLPGPRVEMVLSDLEKSLPTIDYTGAWLEDFNLAKTIAGQQERSILLAFVDMERGDFSKKLDAEIFQTEAFKKYASKNLVLVRADFSASKQQTKPDVLREQHKTLADLHGVRGYPYMIILSPDAKVMGQAKYMKGGPDAFLQQIEALRRADQGRRMVPAEQK